MGEKLLKLPEKPHYIGHRNRLKQKFLDHGPESFQDYELLELLLFFSQPRGDVKPLAKDILKKFNNNFSEILHADRNKLLSIDGVGESTYLFLKAIYEASLRLAKHEISQKPIMDSWKKVLQYCQDLMAYEKNEQFRLLFLDKKNMLIADELQQKGTVDQTPIYVREVVKRSLEIAASAIIMVHNHPSGDPTPSAADIKITRLIKTAIEPLGIKLHDHLIIGKEGHVSMRSMKLI